MRSKQKWLVYGLGVALGCGILWLFPERAPSGKHPWHAQTAPEGYYPLTVTDDYGREVTLATQPRWLISLAPSITEMLFAMGMGDHLLAVTEWDTYPEKARMLRDVGGNVGAMDQPDLEAITGLYADLVLASNLTPATVLDKVTRGRTQALSLHHESFEDVLADVAQLGRVLGVPGKALALQATLRSRRDEIVAGVNEVSSEHRLRAVILLQLEDGLQPGWSPGEGTWLGDLVVMAGGENVAAALGRSWGQISLEGLLAADPEVIFVKAGVSAGANERLRQRIEGLSSHPVWQQMTAVKNGRIVVVPNGPFSIPGPRMVDALEIIAAGLWPELTPAFGKEDPEHE